MGAIGKSFNEIYVAAREAGLAAGNAAKPTPMGFYQSDLAGNRLGPVEVVEDGVCGFAWVWFKGNTAWGRFAKAHGLARADYPTGMSIWIGDHDQSMERKEAHARAFAKVLKENGIDCAARSRMD